MATAALKREPVRNTTVLVIDDDPSIRKLLRSILKSEGCFVHEAQDGKHALELIRELGCVDLVIADVIMPIMSGPELVQRVREKNASTKALFISGYIGDEFVRCSVAGSPFLQKPFTPSQLKHMVRELLAAPVDHSIAEERTRARGSQMRPWR